MNLSENVVRVFDMDLPEYRKNTVVANISSFEGRDQDDNPRYSTWRAFFVGDAYKKALKLENKDKGFLIKLKNAKVENNYNKDKDKLFLTVTIFDFEIEDEDESKAKKPAFKK